jgi:hypothetical protein
MTDETPTEQGRLYTWDEYLEEFSSAPRSDQNEMISDDAEKEAELLAEQTLSIFVSALNGS